jgi:MinD-like ATPase involved in chromosome partitioning or flagellar assembly
MQTITFYSYKGGTGRTLALANAATYLARLGQNVFALDLDLEAPGLHHKFRLHAQRPLPDITAGIVDCIYAFFKQNASLEKIAPYVVQVPSEQEGDGRIFLMPAGNVLTASYWRRLAELDWHELFYKDEAEGIPFFLELKERIREEFKPDYLLIDARTGVTEIGGVATTLLPDKVVCLLLNNQENLEGAREVLRAIQRASKQRQKRIDVIPVLARLPVLPPGEMERESKLARQVRKFLCEDTGDPETRLDLPAVLVLHAEDALAFEESLRIGSRKTVDESPLLRDYLRLFAQIIPREGVEPHLDRLIAAAMKDMLEKPDRVQADLEALATYCPHPESYLALLKFYRLRKAPAAKVLQTAVRYWELSRRSDDPLLRDIVWEHFKPELGRREERSPSVADFVQAVWESSGHGSAEVGLRLVDELLRVRRTDRAVEVVRKLLETARTNAALVVDCLNRLIDAEQLEPARLLVEQWSPTLADDPDFQCAWASLIVRQRDAAAAQKLLERKDFRPASVLAKRPHVYVRLLMLAGRRGEVDAALQNLLDQSLASGDEQRIVEAGRLYDEAGRYEAFAQRIKKSLPSSRAERMLAMASASGRGWRAYWHWQDPF